MSKGGKRAVRRGGRREGERGRRKRQGKGGAEIQERDFERSEV